MVDLLEYEGKSIFKEYGIPVPEFLVVSDEKDIPDFNEKMVIKAQVPTGGRGKRGGVRIVNSKEEAIKAMKEIKNIDFDGYRAEKFILEKAYNIRKELYISVTLDRSAEMPVVLASAEGGVDINSVPQEKIYKKPINPFVGVTEYLKGNFQNFLI
jgi:Succinyl-CoA synthetase, beta subunit